ncbi:MAG: hypothetical protein R2828_05185 [Saprospiraceae bacterium]
MTERIEKDLRKTFREIKDLHLGILLAGVGVLIKDTAEFIAANGFNDPLIDLFRKTYQQVYENDRLYWRTIGPDLYKSLDDVSLPSGVVTAAAMGNLNINPLCQPVIEKEWTRFTGWLFFKTFTYEMTDAILKKSSLREEKEKADNPRSMDDQVIEIIQKLSASAKEGHWYWYPLFLYLSVLLGKTRFETLKETN